jgi:hypothetical protein
VTGAAGRNRAVSLAGRFTPANRTEAFETLIGMGMGSADRLVRSQDSRNSRLIWWLTGKDADGAAFPTPEDQVAHTSMLNETELTMLKDWINTGVNFRVVDDHIPSKLSPLSVARYTSDVWPVLEANCYSCHSTGNSGAAAMDFDAELEQSDNQEELDQARIESISTRINFMVPEASVLLRKPLGEALGGLSHVGGQIFTGTSDPQYLAIYNWITAANPALAPGAPTTDLVNVNNYPNPFRDKTQIVYGLTGNVAADVQIKIYSQNGKLIRELTGPANTATTVGWNRVEWDGKDKEGRSVGNDVYFFTIKAEFGDGVKKEHRGKCVKVN